MEQYARAPDPLTKTDDMVSNWHSWKEDFIIFMKVTGYIDKPNEIRANLLKNRIGKVGIDAIQKISFDKPEDKDDMDILIAKLEEFFNPPKNEAFERYQFFTRDKKQTETIEQYINILKDKAKTCNFKDMTDSIIRDKIILITQDKILCKKYFEVNNLNLQKLVAIYNDYNINIEKMKQVTKETAESTSSTIQKQQPISNNNNNNNNAKKKCWRCNTPHPQGKCPAWGSKCTKCGDVNHFTQCCQGAKPKSKPNDKINNLLDPMVQVNLLMQETVSKNNKGKNQTNSEDKVTDPMTNMTRFPDIPTAPNVANSAFNNDALDFVMLDAYNPGPSFHYTNTTSQSTCIPKNTQYNDSQMKGAKPMKTQAGSSQTMSASNNNFRNIATHRTYPLQNAQFKYNQKKKVDQDSCVLS